MKRAIVIGGGILIVAIVIAVIVLWSSLDGLVQQAVEKYGSQITQANVTLGEVEISPTSGAGALRRLTVGNPAGFKTPNAFKLGEVKIAVDLKTITDTVLLIKEITIVAPEITYEVAANGSNFDALQRNVESYIAAHGGDRESASDDGANDDDDDEKKLIIERLNVRGARVIVSATALDGKTLSANLPAIELRDIGKQAGGAKPGEIVELILAEIKSQIGQSVGSLDPQALLESLGAGELGQKLRESGGDGKKLIEDGSKALEGGLNKLLGR